MQKADDGLRLLMRQSLREKIFWTTIETGMVALGVPDINYLSDGGCEGWVECKSTKANAIKFRPEQIGWHLRRARYGGRTWIAVRRRHRGGVRKGAEVDELWMAAGCWIEQVADQGIMCPHVIKMGDGGPSDWDWGKVRRHLLGRVVTRG